MAYKCSHKARTVAKDRHILEKQLLPAFGANVQIRALLTDTIAVYEGRIMEVSAWTFRNELTVLPHLLRLAHRNWGYLNRVLNGTGEGPEGKTQFLCEDEIVRLLTACAALKNEHLPAIVTIACTPACARERS